MFQEGLRTVYNNESFLPLSPNTGVYNQLTTGANSIALSADGEWLHYAALASRQWWRVPTSLLRVPTSRFGATSMAAIDARNAVEFLGDLQSHPDGFEADAAGTIYLSAPEQNAIYTWKSGMNTPELYVRNGMIQWPDTMSIGTDKRLYFVVNQLWL
jgi:sugar lactone lactonase YvrE